MLNVLLKRTTCDVVPKNALESRKEWVRADVMLMRGCPEQVVRMT